MLPRLLVGFILLNLAAGADEDFVYNGFRDAKLSLDGTAVVTSEGLLRLTNTTALQKSHAFYPNPVRFKRDGFGKAWSFSSTFVFGIIPEFSLASGHGIVLVISPSKDLRQAIGSQYMGIFNTSNNGNPSNHIVAVELDTVQNPAFADINNNHVGVDINGMRSNASHGAGYYADANGVFQNLTLISEEPMQVWVEYDGGGDQLNVTISPMGVSKPRRPLLSSNVDLSSIVFEQMYVGFASSSNPFRSSHYILGWSFKVNGTAQALNLPNLPHLPRSKKKKPISLAIWLSSSAALVSILVAIAGVAFVARRRAKFSELLEDWELAFGPQRFAYKDLFKATHGFRDTELLGAGGFGTVYKGVLPSSKAEVAIKRISHGARQGMKAFIAEVASLGRVRHRNLVQLLGYCRREGELLLVYDFMPNGSLDRVLFDEPGPCLDWSHRFGIIRGVASGLLYLHEEWEQVVIHRDVKASNVLLDGDFNGRLGDFGLARLYDHGSDPQTTHVAGTMGYLAPELTKNGKATKATDVFAFGVFLLEVACGRRPIEPQAVEEEVVMVDWVLTCWSRGEIASAADPRLGDAYAAEEVELVLKQGLLCCDPLPAARPGMRLVVQTLAGDVPLPEFSSNYLNTSVIALLQNEAFDEYMQTYASESTTASLLSGGR